MDKEAECKAEDIMSLIAARFSTARRYLKGDMVVHGSTLYQCSSAGHYGEWDSSHFTPTTVEKALFVKASQADLAPVFSYDADYVEGNLTVRDGMLVECIKGGRGIAAAFVGVTVSGLLSRLVTKLGAMDAALKRAEAALRDLPAVARSVSPPPTWIESIAAPWTSGQEYKEGEMVSRDGRLFCCVSRHICGDTWDGSKWTETTVAGVLDGMTEAFSAALRSKADKT